MNKQKKGEQKKRPNAGVAQKQVEISSDEEKMDENNGKHYESTCLLNQDGANPDIPQLLSQPKVLKKKVAVIASNSIIKNIRSGWRLSDQLNHVVVKSFPRATISDMEDYIKPITRKEPSKIILHVGTNDVKDATSRNVA